MVGKTKEEPDAHSIAVVPVLEQAWQSFLDAGVHTLSTFLLAGCDQRRRTYATAKLP
jgi:hypothetical protein